MIRVFEDLKVPILGFFMNSILSLLQNSFLVSSSFLFFFFFFLQYRKPCFFYYSSNFQKNIIPAIRELMRQRIKK